MPGESNVVADTLSRPPVSSADAHSVADHHVRSVLESWLGRIAPHLTIDLCVEAARKSLEGNRKLAALRCNECSHLHLDVGHYASRKHV